MFNAEIDIQNHNSFVQYLMVKFNMDENTAEKAVVQMEKNMEEIWNNPSKFYKELEELKNKPK